MTLSSDKRITIGYLVILIALSAHIVTLLLQQHFLMLLTLAILCLMVGWLTSDTESQQEKPAGMVQFETVPDRNVSRSSGYAQPLNAFTIDLEDYFHTEVASKTVGYSEWEEMPSRIESSVKRLLDVLDATNTHATVFTLGWVAKKYPALIQEVARRGHEVACHSFRHQPVFRLTQEQFREDTLRAKLTIEDAIGASVAGYRAPNFSITPGTEWAFDTLAELGFRYDSSVHPVWHKLYANPNAPRHPYAIPGTQLLEIPVSTLRVAGRNLPIAGGAYLRLLPFTYTYYSLKHVIERERQPVTLYIHPWELDYLQPVVNTEWKSRIRQTWGTDTLERKLTRLLSTWRFSSIPNTYAARIAGVEPSIGVQGHRKSELLQVG